MTSEEYYNRRDIMNENPMSKNGCRTLAVALVILMALLAAATIWL